MLSSAPALSQLALDLRQGPKQPGVVQDEVAPRDIGPWVQDALDSLEFAMVNPMTILFCYEALVVKQRQLIYVWCRMRWRPGI